MTESPEQIAQAVRAACEALLPEAQQTSKYGGVLFHAPGAKPEAGICGVFAYSAHVSLVFPRGSELSDPDGLLQGKGKARRHLKITEAAQVNAPHVAAFIAAATRLSAL